jgi:hypothetical protein
MNTAIQTIFLPRENILFLEEWLLYHTFIGFDHFYLYDNTGSRGDIYSHVPLGLNKNKYGVPVISKKINDDLINEYLLKICNKFKVTIIKWPSEVIAHNETIEDFIKKFGTYYNYTAFIDMDEYIIFNKYQNIKLFISEELEKNNLFGVIMMQDKFEHILQVKQKSNKKIYEIIDSFELDTRNWAVKYILNTKFIKKMYSMHYFEYTKNILDQPDKNIIKFNHYNYNKSQEEWILNNITSDRDKIKLGLIKRKDLSKYKILFDNWNFTDLSEIRQFDI